MTDIFEQEGITFMQSGYASTHPTVTPKPIPVPPVAVSELTKRVATAPIPAPPDPQTIASRASAGDDTAVPAAPAGAPPQAPADSTALDIFDREDMPVPQATPARANAFSKGVFINTPSPESDLATPSDMGEGQVSVYALQQLEQAKRMAGSRFTPAQMAAFSNNPVTIAEAMQNQDDWPDVPALLEKAGAGEQMTEGQQRRLNEYVDVVLSTNLRGMSWNGNRAMVGGQLPAGAVSYVNSGESGAQPTEEREPKEPNFNGNLIMPPPYAPKVGEKPLNDFMASSDKGRQLMATAKEKPASTALKAAAYPYPEAAKAPAHVNGNLISSINDLPASLRAALYDAYKAKEPKARMSDMMTPKGWNKAVDAIGEEKAAEVIGFWSTMTFEEHQKAQFVGSIFPISEDEQGNKRFDPRAGLTAFLMAPGDVATGKLKPGTPEFNAEGANVGLSIVTGNVGAKVLREGVGGRGAQETPTAAPETVAGEAPAVAPEQAPPPPPPPTVDDLLDVVAPNKDQMMVDSGIVSIDGAKSAPAQTAERILQGKGLTEQTAQEIVANMTANEREQFVNDNLKAPQGSYPTTESIAASGTPSERVAAAQDAATAVGDSQAKAMSQKDPPPIDDNESGYNWMAQRGNYLYRRLINVLDPVEQAEKLARKRGAKIEPGQSPTTLGNLYGNVGALINHHLSVESFTWMPDGSVRVTGKSLKGIMDDFDNIAMPVEKNRTARFLDFNDYLLANRYKELETVGEGKVTPEQIAWSNQRLAALSEKYGDTLSLVENLAQEVYGFQRRTLDMLVDTGVIEAERRDALNTKYQRYIPLNRIFEEAEKQSGGKGRYKGKFSGAGPQGIIMRLKGSSREVREPLLNIFERTHDAVDRAYRNRVAVSIDNLKGILPEYIQVEKPRIVNKGKAEVKITHDPALDKKLDAAIAVFKNKFERNKSVKVKGFRNVLGSYDPMEKLVRTKLGANEAVKTHEVGHMLDYELGLGTKLLKDKDIRAELERLAEERIGSKSSLEKKGDSIEFVTERQKAGKKFDKYIKNDREVIANLFDAYVNAPELLDKIAPKAKAVFEAILDENPELAFIKDIKPSLERAQRTIEQEVWGEATELPPYTIEVFRDGERQLLRLAKPLYEAMTQLGPARMGFLEKLLNGTLGTSARILRVGATSTVSFIERNVFRDQLSAMIQGGVSYNAPWDFTKGLFAAFGKNELYKSWARSGGKMDFMALGDTGMEMSYKEMFHGEGRFKQLWNAVPRLSQKFEQATRIGLYNAAKRKGMSDLDAAMASLEGTLNFGRGGDVTRKLNQYVPFLNAGVQGVDKLIRTAYKNPKATLLWGLGTVTVPSIAITGYYLYGADETTRQEYLEIPQWQKDMFWTIKVDGEWRSIPKPFSWGYIFGSIPERVMIHGYDGDKPEAREMWLDVIKGVFGTMSPVNDWSATIPPLFKVVLEWQSNYNFFFDRNVYPTWMEDLPPEQRKNAYTSQTAQFLGESVGQSPAQIENAIRAQFGGLGGYGLKAGDAMIDQVKRWNDVPVAEKPATDADNILIQGFTLRDPIGSNSNSVQNFFDNYKLAKQAWNGQKNVPEEDKEAYIANRAQQISSYKSMERARKDIAGLQKEIIRITKDTDMSADEKRKTIKDLNSQITVIAREANKEYNAAANAVGASGSQEGEGQ